MNKSITFRIRMRDYKAIRHLFHGQRGETAAQYFARLRVYLTERWENDNKNP